MQTRVIIFITSLLTTVLGLLMFIPAILNWTAPDDLRPRSAAVLIETNDVLAADATAFAASAVICIVLGGGVAILTRARPPKLTIKTAFVMTTVIWSAMCLAAALPFWLGGASLVDALFEAVSGLTTTGSTVFTGLDDRPPGFLLWRALLQWIGGIGIVVTAIAVLPLLNVGGMQLFLTESSDSSEKIWPRAQSIAGGVSLLYLALTVLCLMSYLAVELSPFEAICHAMTTVATGGFSTSDLSMGAFAGKNADLVAVVFMILASLPFSVMLVALSIDLRSMLRRMWRDAQVRGFVTILGALVIGMTIAVWIAQPELTHGGAWRAALFNVTSIMTGTGYATEAYDNWGPFAVGAFLMIMFVGGCAGSTTCGVKIFRHQIAAKAIAAYARSMARPHAVISLSYNGKPVSESALESVLAFYLVFFGCVVALAVLLGVLGLDLITAVSAAATSMANVGPGLGPTIGPAGTFQDLSAPAKLLCCVGMLVGRLEVFTVAVLFSPRFWRG